MMRTTIGSFAVVTRPAVKNVHLSVGNFNYSPIIHATLAAMLDI